MSEVHAAGSNGGNSEYDAHRNGGKRYFHISFVILMCG